MSSAKIAVTLPQSLLEETDALADTRKETRSGLIQKALKEYIAREKQELMLQQLNEVYSEVDSEEDVDFLTAGLEHYAHNVTEEEEW